MKAFFFVFKTHAHIQTIKLGFQCDVVLVPFAQKF